MTSAATSLRLPGNAAAAARGEHSSDAARGNGAGMKLAVVVLVFTLAVAFGALAGTARSVDSGASCQGILSSIDGQGQVRDEVALFFAQVLRPTFGVAPGEVYRDVSQAHLETEFACRSAVG